MRAFGLGIVAAVLLGLAVAAPVSATRVDSFKIAEGAAAVKDYGPIPGVDAANAFTTPAYCETQPSCNVLTLEVVPPAKLASNEDFLVKITLSWDYRKVNGQSTTNLDLIIWDGATAIARSTTSEPEVVTLFRPTKGKYELVVVQRQSGPAIGYKLTGVLTRETISTPFESLAPSFGGDAPPSTPTSAPSQQTTPTPSVSSFAPPAPGIAPMDAGIALALAPLTTDDDLASLGARSGQLDTALRAPTQLIGGPTRFEDAAPTPVAGAVVAFWSLIVPLVSIAAGALWIKTHRAQAF